MNLLFVSIAFPPKKDPECIQTARYFKYLSRYDLKITVATSSSPTLFMPLDKGLISYDTGWNQKVEILINENRYLNFIKRKFGVPFIPDSKAAFHKKWRSIAAQIEQQPDVIYSRSYPLTSAVTAYRLAKYFKIPWILHLSDPWVDSPLHQYTGKEKLFHETWEKKCFERASFVCLTSEKSIEFYSSKYPDLKDRFQLFPNVFDPEDLVESPFKSGEKCRIIYAGGFAGTRSPEVLLRGLHKFNSQNSDHADLELVIAGPADRQMTSIMESYAAPNFQYLGSLPLRDSLKLQKTAHSLVIVDSKIDEPKLAMFFPSKILEYFAAKRRVFAITTNGSSTDELVKSLGFESFTFEDENGIADHFSRMLAEYKKGNADYFTLKEIPAQFSAQTNANRLHQLIKSL